MIRKIFKFFIFIIVLLLILICGAYFYAGELIKAGVEKFVPEITQTAVRLNRVNISLFKGEVSLSGLSIANPKGYGAEKAFGLKSIKVLFDPKTILKDKIIINQILIEGTQVDAEAVYQNGQISSNLTEIQKNVESYLAKQTSAAPAKKESTDQKTSASNASSKQVVIRDLQINNTELTVGVMKQTVTVTLPNIQQKNIGEKGKQKTAQDMIAYIFNLISVEAVKGTVTAVQDALRKGALQLIGTTNDTINSVKETAGNALSNSVSAFGSVKGLLGK